MNNPTVLLFSAIEDGKEEDVRQIIKKHKNVNCQDRFGATPLHHAVTLGKVKIMKVLLEGGAKVDMPADKPEISFRTGTTPLHHAARAGKVLAIRVLGTYKANANAQDVKGATALAMACRGSHADAVYALINIGADPNIADEKGVTPLHIACSRGSASTIHALMKNSADAYAKDESDYTPLFYAARSGRTRSIQAMTVYNVTLDYDENGHTALDVAIRFGQKETVDEIKRLYPDAKESPDPWSEKPKARRSRPQSLTTTSSSSSALPSFIDKESEEQGYIDVTNTDGKAAKNAAKKTKRAFSFSGGLGKRNSSRKNKKGGDSSNGSSRRDSLASVSPMTSASALYRVKEDNAGDLDDIDESLFGFTDEYIEPDAVETTGGKKKRVMQSTRDDIPANDDGDEGDSLGTYIDVHNDGDTGPKAQKGKSTPSNPRTSTSTKEGTPIHQADELAEEGFGFGADYLMV